MTKGSFIFTLLLLIIEGGRGSFFDLDEVEGFHYSINFLSDPLNEDMIEDPPTGSISVPMRNNLGQPFHCILPSPEALASEITEKPPPLEMSPNLMKDVMTLLDPLKDHPCLKRSEGYWVYELCYGQYIKQYHTQDNKPVGNIIILGNYDFEYSEKEHNKNKLLRHYSQYYINGSICDELGTPRKAEVRYVCDPATPSEMITNVEEPALCEYILTVKTSRTCSLPQMRPTPKAKEKTIDCFPLLSSGQFSDYMERKAKKAAVDMESAQSSSNKIMNALSNDKLSEKLIDEIVSLVQSSVSDTPNPGNPLFTVINAQKYLDNVIDSTSTDQEKGEKTSGAEEEDEDIEALIKESSELMKKMSEKYSPEDLSKIMDKIQKGAASNVDEIIKETAEDFKMYLKPLKKAEAAQVLTNSLDTLMTRIKSAIKNVDKGIQDIEGVIKEDKEALEELEESLDAAEDDIDDEASTDNDGVPIKEEEEVARKLPSKALEDGKHDGKRSVKKDLTLQEGDYEGGPPLDADDSNENEEIETKKALDDILSSVQSKINEKMGSVTVKVVSASALDDAEDLPSVSDEEDMKYYSRMMYESMAGNNKAYEDIKKLRRDRKGYMFKITPEEEEEEQHVSASGEHDESTEKLPSSRLVKIPIRLPSSIRNVLLSSKMENNEMKKEEEEREVVEQKDLNVEEMKTKLPVKLNSASKTNHRPKDDL